MTGQPDWVPPGVDTKRANIARVYDYLLGGTHNFLADQDLARAMTAVEPEHPGRLAGPTGRSWAGRCAVLAAAGIRQFLDIGSGIPTQGNVHEVAQQAAPGARVVYADVDPVAIAHSKAILDGQPGRRHHQRRPARAGEDPGPPDRPAADRLQPADRAAAGHGAALHRRRRGSRADRGHAARRARARQLSGAGPRHQRRAGPEKSQAAETVYNRSVARACRRARGPRFCVSSTDSSCWIPAWSTSRSGGPTPRPTCPRTRASSGSLVGVGQKPAR